MRLQPLTTPPGWSWSKVKHVASFFTGWTPPTGRQELFEGENLWANISDLGPRELHDTAKRISDDAIRESAIRLAPQGSLLFSFKLSIGQVSFSGRPMYTNEAIATFPPQPRLHSRWAYWAFPIFIPRNAGENIYGAKLLNQELIRSADVLVPPLNEQERIANFLDEKTARIDTLIAEKERLRSTLAEWYAAELSRICFGSSAAAVLTGNVWISRLPPGWKLMRLKHLTIGVEQGWSPECEGRAADDNEWGVLKSGASNNGLYDDREHKALPSGLEPVPQLEVRPGDVLISRASGSADLVGSFAYVYTTRPKLMLSDKNFRLKFSAAPPLAPELLAWMCNTHALRQQIRQFVSGSEGLARNIGAGSLRELWLAVPPYGIQLSLVSQLRDIGEWAQQLAEHLEVHLLQLREYRSSLICAAVTGQIDLGNFKAAA